MQTPETFISRLLFLCGAAFLTASCTAGARRPVTTAVLSGAGALAGYELAGRDNKSAAIGALAGAAAGEGYHLLAEKSEKKAYTKGYEEGAADAARRSYWGDRYKHVPGAEDSTYQTKLYEVPVPAFRTADGTAIEPHTQVIEIVE